MSEKNGLSLSINDIKWVFSHDDSEIEGKPLDQILGEAIGQWIHTGEIWLITDGEKPVILSYASSVLNEIEGVMTRNKSYSTIRLSQIEKQMSESIVLTRVKAIAFDANQTESIFPLRSHDDAINKALRSFDIVLLAMIFQGTRIVYLVDMGEKADDLFKRREGSSDLKTLLDLSRDWLIDFNENPENYIERFKERTKKQIIIPANWDETESY